MSLNWRQYQRRKLALFIDNDDGGDRGVEERDDGDGDLGSCPRCGSSWFELASATYDDPQQQPNQRSRAIVTPAAVCIDADGEVIGYSGALVCLECGAEWRPHARQRPFLRIVSDDDSQGRIEENFDDLVSDFEEQVVVSFSQQSDKFAPEITASGVDAYDIDRALGVALRGLIEMAMVANGFYHDPDLVDGDEDEDSGL